MKMKKWKIKNEQTKCRIVIPALHISQTTLVAVPSITSGAMNPRVPAPTIIFFSFFSSSSFFFFFFLSLGVEQNGRVVERRKNLEESKLVEVPKIAQQYQSQWELNFRFHPTWYSVVLHPCGLYSIHEYSTMPSLFHLFFNFFQSDLLCSASVSTNLPF